MLTENDHLLSALTVRIQEVEFGNTLGSGVIYNYAALKDKIYILTAAHVLFADGDDFVFPFTEVDVAIYCPLKNVYRPFRVKSESWICFKDPDKDVAVIVMDRMNVESISGSLPEVLAVRERGDVTTFGLKGFPQATLGIELDAIYPVWKQRMTSVNKFQLQLDADYTDYSTQGFSGSGIFLREHDRVYLYGIFTRFRSERNGKVIYAQYLSTVNELLESHFHPGLRFTFLGERGLTMDFFKTHIETAIEDLGPRYSKQLNFKLPAGRMFNDLAKDELFKKRFLNVFHQWLVETRYYERYEQNEHLADLTIQLGVLRSALRQWILDLTWDLESRIDYAGIMDQVYELGRLCYEKQMSLYQLQFDMQRKSETKWEKYGSKPLDEEIRWLRETLDHNSKLEDGLGELDVELSNHPAMLIYGEAGCGKSHLLGDIASSRISKGYPVLLFLGQHFKNQSSIWQNILEQLGLDCSRDQLLGSLNQIGKQIGSRVLVMIDAINEGAGKELWLPAIAGFLKTFGKYPNIALVLAVRDTYYRIVVPQAVFDDKLVRKYQHQGFKGNEYAALKWFCEKEGLQQPNFPILSGEFANPLFLQMTCEGVKKSGSKTFPSGFQGFYKIFEHFLKAIHGRISIRREEYTLKTGIVNQAVTALAEFAFKRHTRSMVLEEVVDLFEDKFPKHLNLLNDLIQENLITRKLDLAYGGQEQDVVYFAFDRFGDFFIARNLLEKKTKEEVMALFSESGELGMLVSNEDWYDYGMIEAMAILLPEKFGLEITEVLYWTREKDSYHWLTFRDVLDGWLLSSLKWRAVESIEPQKIFGWLERKDCSIEKHTYFNLLIELSTVQGHPFNAHRLFSILKDISMPERDSFWQYFLVYNSTYDGESPTPFRRLSDWAWTPEISGNVESETAFLAALTLAWGLSSSATGLRDRTTKAMVNLLELQPEAIVRLIETYSGVDDMYLQERLYAIAYGCALRVQPREKVLHIAQCVFDHVFREGRPPAHVLLRDYAKNIIEYALYLKLDVRGDMSLIIPPYKCTGAIIFPSREEVSKFYLEKDDPKYSREQNRIFNQIHHSTLSWDFGNKIIDSKFRDFERTSFVTETEFKLYLKKLRPNQRALVKLYDQVMMSIRDCKGRLKSYLTDQRRKMIEDHLEMSRKLIDTLNEKLEKELNLSQLSYLRPILSLHEDPTGGSRGIRGGVNTNLAKYWIVKRAFELGYSIELHFEFDEHVHRYSDFHKHKVERIGKKYQWIAFYELFGMMTDRYRLRSGWGSAEKFMYYQGPWQKYLRDIDPVYIIRDELLKQSTDEDDDQQMDIVEQPKAWWAEPQYDYWSQPTELWVVNKQDLPDPRQIILKTDETGQEWVYLSLDAKWNEPVPFGEETFEILTKEILYWIRAYLVKNADKGKLVKALKKANFYGNGLMESQHDIGLLNRENYWSAASRFFQAERKTWEKLDGTSVEVMLSADQAVGEVSQDSSDARKYYLMPGKQIFETLGLRYAVRDGEFIDGDGKLVATAINPNGLLIRKSELRSFLKEEELDVVWVLSGEKQSFGNRMLDESCRSSVNGVYIFDDEGSITGDLKVKLEE